MTKEELKKEAREDVDSLNGIDLVSSTIIAIDKYGAYKLGRYDGYLAGAESREKRIAELEVQIEKMKCCGNCIHCYEGAYHNGYRCKDHAKESVCDNWEMMTDKVRKEMLEDD